MIKIFKILMFSFTIIIVVFIGGKMTLGIQKNNINKFYLFQKNIFNLPSEDFLVLKISNSKNISISEKMDYIEASALYGDNIRLKSTDKGFIIFEWEKYNRKLFYSKIKTRYEYFIINLKDNIVEHKFSSLLIWGASEDTLFYIDGGFNFSKYNISEGTSKLLCKEISAFIYLNENNVLLFDTSGNLMEAKIDKNGCKKNKVIKHIGGIVTDAGLLEEKLGWYYWRKNEYSPGYLAIINTETYDIFKNDKIYQCKFIKRLSGTKF